MCGEVLHGLVDLPRSHRRLDNDRLAEADDPADPNREARLRDAVE